MSGCGMNLSTINAAAAVSDTGASGNRIVYDREGGKRGGIRREADRERDVRGGMFEGEAPRTKAPRR